MKYTLFLFLLLKSLSGFSQTELIKNDEGVYSVSEVVQCDSMTASDIYLKARLFIASAYKSAQHVTQLEDDKAKTIVIKALVPFVFRWAGIPTPYGHINYTVTISCKDGRYKVEISNFYHTHSNPNGRDGGALEQNIGIGFTKKTWEQAKEAALSEALIIKSQLRKTIVEKKSDNW